MTQKLKLKNVRLSFPDLFKAVEFKTGDGKPRFNASFLVDPGSPNDKAIQAAIAAEALEAFGAKGPKIVEGMKGNANKYCYLDGDTKPYDGYEGKMCLTSHAKTAPGVFTNRTHNGKVCYLNEQGTTFQLDQFGKLQPVDVDFKVTVPYAGCMVNATVEIWGQKGENQGMRCSVTGVQFADDGEAFSGGSAASPDEFDDLGDGADAADDMS